MAKRKKKAVSRTLSRKRVNAELQALSDRVASDIRTGNPEVLFVQAKFLAWLYDLQLKTQGKKKFSDN